MVILFQGFIFFALWLLFAFFFGSVQVRAQNLCLLPLTRIILAMERFLSRNQNLGRGLGSHSVFKHSVSKTCTVCFPELPHERLVASPWVCVSCVFPSPQLNLLPEHFTLPRTLPSRSVLRGIKWTNVCSLHRLCVAPCFATFPLFKLLPFMAMCNPATQSAGGFEPRWILEGIVFLNLLNSTLMLIP